MSWNPDNSLQCDMVKDCRSPVTHIDNKGYVYCKAHGIERKSARSCRQLKPWELRTLLRREPIHY